MGPHIHKVSLPDINIFLRFEYFFTLSGQNALSFMKLSLIALYWRIFKLSVIRIPILVMAVLVSMWTIAFVSLHSR